MKVGIDISRLNKLSGARGIGYYTKNLYEALKKYTGVEVELIEEPSNEKFDLIHYPYFDLFAPTLKVSNIPTVVTIHDVIPLLFPQHYPPGIRGRLKTFKQKLQLKKVAGVITDSDCSKKDIVKKLGMDSNKIDVVYLAAGENFKKISDKAKLKKISEKYSLPDQFVLFTGSTNWNKNLLNITRGALDVGVDIAFAGKSFENRDNIDHPELKTFKKFLKEYSNSKLVHILGFIPDGDIVELYNLASILMLPSFYEGFGMTILEAQRCGVPVITSKTSSLKEVAGQGAKFVNPESAADIKRAISDILEEKKLRDDLIAEGFENVKRFSWEKTAKETAQVYEKYTR